MAKIDILLTYWGDFDLLKKAVESVISQTEKDWQLLVFDDCYPSKDAAKYFNGIKDKRIKYHRHSKNIGITKNFNFALDKASAEYCVMFGCDDIMLPKFIEMALSKIGNSDFYQPAVDIINDQGKLYLPIVDRIKRFLRPNKPDKYLGEKLAISLCLGNWLYFPSIVWKTSTIKKYRFNLKYKIVEDVDLELKIIRDGGTLYVDNETTFQYRRFSNSLSSIEKSKDGVRFTEEKYVYNYFGKEFKKIGWHKAALTSKIRIMSRLHRLIS